MILENVYRYTERHKTIFSFVKDERVYFRTGRVARCVCFTFSFSSDRMIL